MKNRNVKLSFCIPTWNRAKLVYGCVKKILQYKGDDIEVVVCDNGSEDKTFDLLKTIKDYRFRYYRNEKNVGFVKNVIKVSEKAEGKFLFLISDEDRVNINIIPKIIQIISKNDKLSAILGTVIGEYGSTYLKYNDGDDKIIKKGDEAIEKLAFQHLYFSGVIVNVNYIDFKDIENETSKFGYGNIHMYPQEYILMKNYVKGDVLTISDVVCEQYSFNTKSNSDTINGLVYYETASRIIQFERNVLLITSIVKSFDVLFNMIIKMYRKSLFMATLAYESVMNGKKSSLMYVPAKLEYKFNDAINEFYQRSYNLLKKIISQSKQFESLNKKIVDATNEIICMKIKSNEIVNYLKNDNRLILFGASGTGIYALKILNDLKSDVVVECFIDNDTSKVGKKLEGVEIKSFKSIKYIDETIVIIISSIHENEIYEQLKMEHIENPIYKLSEINLGSIVY